MRDDGDLYDWLNSPYIVRLNLLAAVMLAAFLIVERLRKEPLIRLRGAGNLLHQA